MNSRIRQIILWAVLVVVGLVLWRMIRNGAPNPSKIQEINYTEFKSLVENDRVANLTLGNNEAYGEYRGDKNHTFHLTIQTNNQEMYKLLDQGNVRVEYKDSQSGNWVIWLIQVAPLLGGLLQIVVIVLVCFCLVSIQRTLNQILQELRKRDLKPGLGKEQS